MALKSTREFWVSIELCVGLLASICIVMAGGSFLLKGNYVAAINSVPLLVWLREVPIGVSWWLWLVVLLLALLVINTIYCSWDTIRFRCRRGGWLSLYAPQFIHAGFLLIVLAHLISAYGGYMQQVEVAEGQVIQLPDGRQFGVAGIHVSISSNGMPVGYSGELVTDFRNPVERVMISPNHPLFSGGYGVYIKQAEGYPFKRALLEIHREPGAGLALAGAVVFTVGNVLIVWLRSRAKENDLEADCNEVIS